MTYRIGGSVALAIALLAGLARGQGLPAGTRTQKDVTYASVNGKDLKLDIYFPPTQTQADAVLVRLSPQRETPNAAAAELLKNNFVLVYAGYMPDGAASRAFSPFPGNLQAAKAAVRFVRGNAATLHADKDRIGVWGAGHGATIAALLGVTADQKSLNGTLGEFPNESSAVRAVCLFEGITDWRNAELYGDESVNIPGSPAYQLFGGNPKEHPDEARQASAVNYITPQSPATLMVTLSSDEQRAMHLIYAETLRKAGVRSALYEEPLGAGNAARGVDEARLNRTVVQFFADTMREGAAVPEAMNVNTQIAQLTGAGLFKQARLLVDEQISALTGSDAATLPQRTTWLRKLREINDEQQALALNQLLAAKKAGRGALPDGTSAAKSLWTIREVLTDPERIGQYNVEATVSQRVFEARADAMKFIETLNTYLVKNDLVSADRQATVLRDVARRGDADPAILNEFLGKYEQIRGKASHVWPPGVRGVAYASDFGQDLYGYWMDIKSGGITQRMRYVPPVVGGRFIMGSSKEEWGRLPAEPILEPVTISKGFWLGDSEVTQGMYEAVMGKDENRGAFRVSGNNAEIRLKLPIENVSYAHAVNFLNKLGVEARLPTEIEWEYACRAGSTYMYSGTGRLSDMGWFWDEARRDKNGNLANPASPAVSASGDVDIRILHELETDQSDVARLTHPVKQKLPNPWGLYDMQGNVWEWCSGTSADKPRDYHPAKGGSWISIPQSCRAARDVWFPVEQQSWNLGLRICMSAN